MCDMQGCPDPSTQPNKAKPWLDSLPRGDTRPDRIHERRDSRQSQDSPARAFSSTSTLACERGSSRTTFLQHANAKSYTACAFPFNPSCTRQKRKRRK